MTLEELDAVVDEFFEGEKSCGPVADYRCPGHEMPKAKSLIEAIENAALSICSNGKMHDHQRRLGRQKCSEVAKALRTSTSSIEAAQDFKGILEVVAAVCNDIFGADELMAYDTALRISVYRNIEPREVYLHAGARVGARKLGFKGDILSMDSLPWPIRRLTPAQVETFFCIFKGRFRKLSPV